MTRRGRSLRFQIVALLLGLLALSCLAVAGVTAFALHGFLIQQLDQQLTAAGDRYSVSLEHPDAHNSTQFGSVRGQAAGTLGARILNGTVTVAQVVPHDADDTDAMATCSSTACPSARSTRP